MAKDAELDRLKTAQDLAYQRKQDAYQAQQRAWEKKRSSARDAINRAFEAMQRAYAAQDSTWLDLQRMRDSYGPIIERLNSLQETAFQNMKRAFDNASSAYDRRDGAGAASYAAEGHRYEAESQGYVNVRRGLVAELRSAKERHDATKPAFQRAKDDFNSAKRAFDSANAAKAGVPHQYHDNVWISTDSSGNTNIYFGGFGKPNGPGHGHYVMDRSGKVTYMRDPFDPHGAQNVMRYEQLERRLSAVALTAYHRDRSSTGPRSDQYHDGTVTVKVRSAGYNRKTNTIATDVIVIDRAANPDEHLHIIFSEHDGSVLFSEWRKNH